MTYFYIYWKHSIWAYYYNRYSAKIFTCFFYSGYNWYYMINSLQINKVLKHTYKSKYVSIPSDFNGTTAHCLKITCAIKYLVRSESKTWILHNIYSANMNRGARGNTISSVSSFMLL